MKELDLGFWNAWLMSVPFIGLVACMVGTKRAVTKRMSDMTGYSAKEKIFTVLASLSPYPFVIGTIWIPLTSQFTFLVLGLFIYVLGMAMLAVTLKVIVETPPDKPFQKGPYRFSRNPMYVAATAVFVGICLAAANPLLFCYVVVATLLQHAMILAEERICFLKYGASFEDYAKRVPRYLW